MNRKFILLFPLCLIAITSGCESTPSSPYTAPSRPISINERCPEGTVAKVVTDMRNHSTIECVLAGVREFNETVPHTVQRGYGVAGITIR